MAEARRMRPLLGTYVEIGAVGADASTQRALNEAFSVIEAIQASLSFQDPDSELSRLNRAPGRWVAVSRIGLRVLQLARAIEVLKGWASFEHMKKARLPAAPVASVPAATSEPKP